MLLEKVPDNQYYSNILGNENVQICTSITIMGSFRVVVHPDDNYNIWCSLCCGKNEAALLEVYTIMKSWIEAQDDIDTIQSKCEELRYIESKGQRPWGMNPTLQKEVRSLIDEIKNNSAA